MESIGTDAANPGTDTLETRKHEVALKAEIPFCLHRCPFCNRTPIEGWDSTRLHAYMRALQREIEANADQFSDCRITSIRLGGGLASMAKGEDISDTLHLIRSLYDVAPDAGVSMRASISNISGASMPYFLRAGIRRFDFEMMSLDTFDFPEVNRRDNLRDFPTICECFLHSYRTDRLGLVLAYGIAGDERPLRRTMHECARGDARHVELVEFRGGNEASPEEKAEQLDQARMILAEGGFREYAPLMFARKGHEDAVLAIEAGIRNESEPSSGKTAGGLLAFGLGAKTYFGGIASTNTSDLELYLEHSDDFRRITAKIEQI